MCLSRVMEQGTDEGKDLLTILFARRAGCKVI